MADLKVNRAELEAVIIKKLRTMRGFDLAMVASGIFDVDCKRVGKSNKNFNVHVNGTLKDALRVV